MAKFPSECYACHCNCTVPDPDPKSPKTKAKNFLLQQPLTIANFLSGGEMWQISNRTRRDQRLPRLSISLRYFLNTISRR